MTHRGKRKMQMHVQIVSLGFLLTPFVAFFVARDYVFDVLFFWMLGYAATAWIPIYPQEKRAFYARYRAWAEEVKAVDAERPQKCRWNQQSCAASIAALPPKLKSATRCR